MTRAVFVEEYGFEPIHMIDLKALMGDASDRLPGVPGIGEKTALSLVRMYGSIDRLYDAMPDIVIAPETPAKPGMVKKLAAGEESARESYYLATIVTDVPDFSFTPGDNLRQEPKQGLYDLFLRLEFIKTHRKVWPGAGAKKNARNIRPLRLQWNRCGLRIRQSACWLCGAVRITFRCLRCRT